MATWEWSTTAVASFQAANRRQNIWHGSVRSGKTITSLAAWIVYVRLHAPPGPLLMIGKTERTLKRNILEPLRSIVGTGNYQEKLGDGQIHLYGRTIYLAGANDERSAGKIQGLTLAGAYGDELSLWPESFYKMLLSRLSIPGARLYATTNPDSPYHWLKTEYLDRSELDIASFRFRLEDNVALDPTYVMNLKREFGPGSLWYRRFIEGDWVAAEGAVFDFFDEGEHVIDTLPRAPDHVDLSVDYGTSNATSVGAYGVFEQPVGDLRAVRLGGYYHDGRATGRQKTDEEYGEEIDAWLRSSGWRPRRVFVDPSAASFQAELRRRSYRVQAADNEVIDGIRTQARMLRNGEYRILRGHGNEQAIRDYGAYLWDAKAQDRGEDRPLKQHDHTKDEERYFLFSTFGAARASLAEVKAKAGIGGRA